MARMAMNASSSGVSSNQTNEQEFYQVQMLTHLQSITAFSLACSIPCTNCKKLQAIDRIRLTTEIILMIVILNKITETKI